MVVELLKALAVLVPVLIALSAWLFVWSHGGMAGAMAEKRKLLFLWAELLSLFIVVICCDVVLEIVLPGRQPRNIQATEALCVLAIIVVSFAKVFNPLYRRTILGER